MKVSVIMTVYNKASYVRESVESIFNQTFQDLELIIVNDGSTDQSKEILDSYKDHPKIKIIHKEKNSGIAKATNTGISHASGEYIAILDGDDIALPERLEIQVKYLDDHPEIGLLGSYYKAFNSAGEIIAEVKPHTNNKYIQRSLIRRNQFGGSTVIMRKSMLDKVGGYNEDDKYGSAADYDLWLRLSEVTEVANIPQYLMLYRVYAEQSTHNNKNDAQAKICRNDARMRRSVQC